MPNSMLDREKYGLGSIARGISKLGKKALKNIVKTDDLHLVIVGRAMKKDLKDLKIENTIYDKFYSGKSDFLNLIYSSADLLTVPS